MLIRYLGLVLLLCPFTLSVEEWKDECRKTGVWPETDKSCPEGRVYCCSAQFHTVCCTYEAYEEEQNQLDIPDDVFDEIGKIIVGLVVGCIVFTVLVLCCCCCLPCCCLAKKRKRRGVDRGQNIIVMNEAGMQQQAVAQPLVNQAGAAPAPAPVPQPAAAYPMLPPHDQAGTVPYPHQAPPPYTTGGAPTAPSAPVYNEKQPAYNPNVAAP